VAGRLLRPLHLAAAADHAHCYRHAVRPEPDGHPLPGARPAVSWLDVANRPAGATISQGSSTYHRASGFDRWQDDPTTSEYTLDAAGTWRLLDPGAGEVHVSGRLLGGCIETVSILAGTAYGDVPAFVREHAPEGLLVYLEASGDVATDIARDLWRMRLAGWFDHANAVLVGRTRAPDADGFSQVDAVRSALDGIDVPVVLEVDCGHVPPHLALVNGAQAQLTLTDKGYPDHGSDRGYACQMWWRPGSITTRSWVRKSPYCRHPDSPLTDSMKTLTQTLC